MKHQQVNVDYYAMLKSMFTYGALAILGWIMFRLFNTVFMFPRRMRDQHQQMQNSLKDLQRRFPELDITEEDLINADKDLEEMLKEDNDEKKEEDKNAVVTENDESKKTI